MNARDLLSNRRQQTDTAYTDKRVKQAKAVTERQVFRGTVQGRNPGSGEYRIDTGGGRYRWAKAVTTSDLKGKSVLVTISGKIGQVAEMPGFA